MTHNEMIAVIQAHQKGARLQFRKHIGRDWEDVSSPGFSFYDTDYRIKPEPPKPREFWFIKNCGIDGNRYAWTRHDVRQEGVDYLEQIHVREILPE